MDEPPPYDESSAKPHTTKHGDKRVNSLRLSVVEQVGISRSQRVGLVVDQMLDQIQGRARKGLSKTVLYLLPLDQEIVRTGQLAGHANSEAPIIVELDAEDSLEFWSQEDALKDMQQQLLAAVLEGVPHSSPADTLPPMSPMPPRTQGKTSWWRSRRQDPAPSMPHPTPRKEPVTVEVCMDELYFRKETEFGLLETRRAQAVLLVVVVR